MQYIDDVSEEYIHRNMVGVTTKILDFVTYLHVYVDSTHRNIRGNLFYGSCKSFGGLTVFVENQFDIIAQGVVAFIEMANNYGSRQRATDVAA